MRLALLLLLFSPALRAATLADAIPLPRGYERLSYPGGSFSHWVQRLGVLERKQIKTYDGDITRLNFHRVFAVVDRPLLFKDNLEQCADYCMRLWADYHQETGRLDELYLFNYPGQKQPFKDSGLSYRAFLRRAMGNANSHSLKKGALDVAPEDLRPGDMVVQNKDGGIGHASMVLDVCRNAAGKRLYLMGYSFIPAQEFHVEKAAWSNGEGGWFSLEGFTRLVDGEYHFGKPHYRRFAGSPAPR